LKKYTGRQFFELQPLL